MTQLGFGTSLVIPSQWSMRKVSAGRSVRGPSLNPLSEPFSEVPQVAGPDDCGASERTQDQAEPL
jgi:hypothetical protein